VTNSEEMLRRVAAKLSQLRWRTLFLGGAVTHRLITDPAASKPSPTTDVDVVVDITSLVTYQVELRAALRRLGAREDTSEDAPLCRWIVDSVRVDVMPLAEDVLGFTNPWYAAALARAKRAKIGDAEVLLIDAPHFLATKIAAFQGRGGGDFLLSKDVDDIVALVDGRPELVTEVRAAGNPLQSFVSAALQEWLPLSAFQYAVEGYLETDADRTRLVLRRFEEMTRI
jgi:hypothetical protein